MKKLFTGIIFLTGAVISVKAQDMQALSTGNFTGVAGMTANPASIVDSRLKFDLNIFGVSNYFTNNYLSVKRNALTNGSFFKDKYKSWPLVQKDLLEENALKSGEKVYARVNNRVLAPFSFMLTTGTKSAIAVTITNRTGAVINNIDQDFARLAYNRFGNAGLYDKNINMNGVNATVLNWLSAGLTYGRVLVNEDKHFLKAAVTAKYIGGVASGYFSADELNIKFHSKDSLSAQTPYMQYGHGTKLGFDMFKAASLKSLRPEAEGFGWDAGLVYEFRGRIAGFKYLTPENNEKTRRDNNKYTFRLGVSIVDAGKLTFDKGGYNNDFSANINNWKLPKSDIKSIRNIDTLLSSKVNYPGTADGSYTIALPTALSVQFDLHLFRGFYINAMTYQPMKTGTTDKQLKAEASYTVTPRFESRAFGLYVPVSYNKLDSWNVGAALRLGPLYIGSANLGSLVFNSKVKTADVYMGLHIPIAFGSPSKIAKLFNKIGTSNPNKENKENIVYTTTTTTTSNNNNNNPDLIQQLKARVEALEKQKWMDSVVNAMHTDPAKTPQQPVTINITNYGGGTNLPGVTVIDTAYQRYNNNGQPYAPQYNYYPGTDRPIIINQPQPINNLPPVNNYDPAQPVIVRDTLYRNTKDTVWQTQTNTNTLDYTPENLVNMSLEKILFDVNKSAVQPVHYSTLNFVAAQLRKYPSLNLNIDGYTDKSGNAAVNETLSRKRAGSVKDYLLRNGASSHQLRVANHGANSPVADNVTSTGKVLNRRVELHFEK